MKQLQNLKHVGYTQNVKCGLLQGGTKRVVGCGKAGRLMKLSYKLDGYDLQSTVSLCKGCYEKQVSITT